MRWSFLFDRIKRPVTRWGLRASVLWLLLAGCQPLVAPVQPTPRPTVPVKPVVDVPPAAAVASAAAGYDTVAFVRAGVLYIQTVGAVAIPIEDCTALDCRPSHLKWSPGGRASALLLGASERRVWQVTGANSDGGPQRPGADGGGTDSLPPAAGLVA